MGPPLPRRELTPEDERRGGDAPRNNISRFAGWVPCPGSVIRVLESSTVCEGQKVQVQIHKLTDKRFRWEVTKGPYAVYPAYTNNKFVGSLPNDLVIQGRRLGRRTAWSTSGLSALQNDLQLLCQSGRSCRGQCL